MTQKRLKILFSSFVIIIIIDLLTKMNPAPVCVGDLLSGELDRLREPAKVS